MAQKSIHNYIVTPENDKEYNNTTESGLILNSSINSEDAQYINRIGVVNTIPFHKYSSVKVGDRIVVQHNSFRNTTDMDGILKRGKLLGDGQYFIRPDHVYAYHSNVWRATSKWVFVIPINHKHDGVLESQEERRPDQGIVAFEQDPLYPKEGISVGDHITFVTGRKVTTVIDGETYYRINYKDILLCKPKKATERESLQPLTML